MRRRECKILKNEYSMKVKFVVYGSQKDFVINRKDFLRMFGKKSDTHDALHEALASECKFLSFSIRRRFCKNLDGY